MGTVVYVKINTPVFSFSVCLLSPLLEAVVVQNMASKQTVAAGLR